MWVLLRQMLVDFELFKCSFHLFIAIVQVGVVELPTDVSGALGIC